MDEFGLKYNYVEDKLEKMTDLDRVEPKPEPKTIQQIQNQMPTIPPSYFTDIIGATATKVIRYASKLVDTENVVLSENLLLIVEQ